MANEAGGSMPAGFGGLMRYNEEYDSKFKFGPGVVVGMIVVVILFFRCHSHHDYLFCVFNNDYNNDIIYPYICIVLK